RALDALANAAASLPIATCVALPGSVAVVPEVQLDRAGVADAAHYRHPAATMQRTVELMPMNHEHPLVVCRLMHQVRHAFDRTEQHPHQLAVVFVVIAGKKYDPAPASPPRPDFLDHRGLIRRPAPSRSHAP